MSLRNDVPLCVDMDGTLLRTDVLWEGLFAALRGAPWTILLALWALLSQGRAAFKRRIAQGVQLEFDGMPLNPELLSALTAQHAAGRRLILCTAAIRSQAEAVAARFELFDEILATDGDANLSGRRKAALLVERFGRRGFDYAGNARADIAVWREARHAWVVNAPASVAAAARKVCDVEQELDRPGGRLRFFIKALRPHQAVKNMLLFVPLLAAHSWGDTRAVIATLIGFLAFSLLAPATYLLNDALDVAADRRHPRKRKRPFASGDLPLSVSALAMPVLIGMSVLLACTLPPRFGLMLATYLVVTLAYSFRLKRAALLDALVLAALYVIRILAGSAATGLATSFWLLAFSMFLFYSLALAKRYTELKVMLDSHRVKAEGRGYLTDDLPLLQSLGTSSGYLAVLVLALYVNDPVAAQLYSQAHVLWGLCPIMLWWLGRVWIYTHRGLMHDDPVIFALKDRQSRLGFLLALLLLVLAR